ncbi:MAG: DUF1565 domain-containing protein [Fuerstiella sp.]|nr:DUF1565 domain-containing protein [Fuerstiella sp.]MCP4854860.1 DUF1565 domain-containing protein [Fuerstiella sp.]
MRVLIISLTPAFILLPVVPAQTADYWVAPSGNDANPGSRENPFRTIQKAMDVIRTGETCTVRAGTYRESVRIRNSGTAGKPIRLIAADGERVVFDGTDLLTGPWEHHQRGIYSTTVDGSLEQVFVDGMMQIEARWPNMRFTEIWDRTKWASSEHGSRKDLMICNALAHTGIDWTGALATLNVGHQYKTWTRDVTQYSTESNQFRYELNERLGDGKDDGATWADDRFYLSGKLEALDAATEWYYDAQHGRLYLWCDDGLSPAQHRVAVKRRTYAISADQQDHIEIVGFHFFAATFRMNECNHCLVDRCQLQFPVCSRRLEERTPRGKSRPEPSTLIAGDHNTIRRTSVALSNVGGLTMRGSHCRIENCIVHDVNWGGSISHPGIAILGRSDRDNHNVVSRCTVSGVGNIGILYRGPMSNIEHNHVFGVGRACRDIAAIHTGGVRARDSVAHHNWVHDSTGLGMRGDDQTRGLTFHHNVVWNCRRGIVMKGNFNKVYHNTVLVDPQAEQATDSITIPKRAEPKKWWTPNPTLPVQNEDTWVFNNAAFLVADRGGTPTSPSDLVSHNVLLPRNLRSVFANASAQSLAAGTFDLRPAPGSPLIDSGRQEPGLADEFRGTSPDAGAYEAGSERWTAGADWKDQLIGVEFVVRLEPPHKHPSIPLPKLLHDSGISANGMRQLQKLHDKLWEEGDRISLRKKAISLRERYPENSPEHREHHAIVAKLHAEVQGLLRQRGTSVLSGRDLAAFKKAMRIK